MNQSKRQRGFPISICVGVVVSGDALFAHPDLSLQIVQKHGDYLWVVKGNQGEPQIATPASPLSHREIQMLEHIAQGNSNKEIAKLLNISDQTVKNHITSILKKLSVDDRTAAVVHALRHGWIVLERR